METPLSLPAKAIAVLAAGALAFALAGGGLLLLTDRLFEGWIFLAAFAAVPAAAIALLPFSARIFCFVLGLLAAAGTWLLDPSGPHNPMILLPWIAWCLAGAAVVAEVCVRAARNYIGVGHRISAERLRQAKSKAYNSVSDTEL